ncbi:MAG: hypothetical protein P8L77_00820 [Gammaproteobacteria bacterium]|nr:hypothetical protein [Gammaproteobacteria bacterium]
MFKSTKWLIVMMLAWPIMLIEAHAADGAMSQFFKTKHENKVVTLVNYLKSQNIHIVLNGQTFSMYIPVDQVFVPGSTNRMAPDNLIYAIHSFINQYDPDGVSIIGRYDIDVAQGEKDLVREQAILLMKSLDLKSPGRIVVSGLEGIYKNSQLEFWQQVKTTRLIEVRWNSKLKVEYMVLNEGKTSK